LAVANPIPRAAPVIAMVLPLILSTWPELYTCQVLCGRGVLVPSCCLSTPVRRLRGVAL
jgi:hypothetical protein